MFALRIAVILAAFGSALAVDCETLRDASTCRSSFDSEGNKCSWCVCAAVPSSCVNISIAKSLPPSVFQCDLFASNPMDRFQQWKAKFGKVYQTVEEETMRFRNFLMSMKEIEEHNSNPSSTYTLGLTPFADTLWEEFKALKLGASQNCSATTGTYKKTYDPIPEKMDWRDKIPITVKDQGSCGSCWTFSTTGALEAHHYLATGQVVSLSEQQLVDCAQAFDNHGCNGGLPSHAFEYIASAGGLDTEAAYVYTAKDGKCKFDPAQVGARVKASVNITFQDEDELLQAVGSKGPVSIAFQVASDFRLYTGGVYDSKVCKNGPKDVNHAVVAVGYDTDATAGPYWIIKNSWGTGWGVGGYFEMARGKNMCGIADCAAYPDVSLY